ncbi:MAG: hypothetical protein JEZ11_01735 [Desulfobacterales bacterium]|nr:hypothetical protein [Desulfobacterales bacterium]
MGEVPTLQDRLDAVQASGMIACMPTHKSLILYYDEKELGRIPLDDVTDVSLIVDSSVKRNYTIFRCLLLGPLVLLFPKKTIQETYRLCIQWIDMGGEYQFTYVPILTRIMADHILNAVKRSLNPAVRPELVQKIQAKERAAVSGKMKQHLYPVKNSPFITCENCTMEFRKSDLPSGGKCPVCRHSLNRK